MCVVCGAVVVHTGRFLAVVHKLDGPVNFQARVGSFPVGRIRVYTHTSDDNPEACNVVHLHIDEVNEFPKARVFLSFFRKSVYLGTFPRKFSVFVVHFSKICISHISEIQMSMSNDANETHNGAADRPPQRNVFSIPQACTWWVTDSCMPRTSM